MSVFTCLLALSLSDFSPNQSGLSIKNSMKTSFTQTVANGPYSGTGHHKNFASLAPTIRGKDLCIDVCV